MATLSSTSRGDMSDKVVTLRGITTGIHDAASLLGDVTFHGVDSSGSTILSGVRVA